MATHSRSVYPIPHNNSMNSNQNKDNIMNEEKFDLSNHPHSKLSRSEQLKIRIVQKKTAFIFGLPLSICNKSILSSSTWFGEFGNIISITIGSSVETDSFWARITYSDQVSAHRAINYMNNEYTFIDGRVCKATFGYKRYCQYWLHNKCIDPNCDYLHSFCNLNELNDVITDDMAKRFHLMPGGQRTVNNKYWDNKFGKTSRQLYNGNNSQLFAISNTKQITSYDAKPFTNWNMTQQHNDQQVMIWKQQQRINQLTAEVQQKQQYLSTMVYSYNCLESKYDKLEIKCMELQMEINKMNRNKKDGYLMWSVDDLYDWIMAINNGYFRKYKVLDKNLKDERIDGECLSKLDRTDLHRLGITNFNDKIVLMEKIKKLMTDYNTVENDNDDEGFADTK